MGKLKTTKILQGDYGELLFEHFSLKNQYAYITLEELYNTLTPKNEVCFRIGRKRIKVKLPEDAVEEIRRVCVPRNKSRDVEPYFTYDFLTFYAAYYLHKNRMNGALAEPTKEMLTWIEVKTGKSKLSKNQSETAKNIEIDLKLFHIPLELPEEIEVEWYHTEKGKVKKRD